MLVRVCDMCGTQMEMESNRVALQTEGFKIDLSKSESLTKDRVCDICPGCRSVLMKTIEDVYSGNPFNPNRDRVRIFVKGANGD